MKPQRQLNRLALLDGHVVVNPRTISGRSAYLCRDQRCWSAAEKRRAVERALGVRLAASDWAQLRAGILT